MVVATAWPAGIEKSQIKKVIWENEVYQNTSPGKVESSMLYHATYMLSNVQIIFKLYSDQSSTGIAPNST